MEEIDTTASVEGDALPLNAQVEEAIESPSTSSGRTDLDGEPDSSLAPDGDPADDSSSDDELEEIERGGRRAKIPSWLKPELMMQADYTRKTQELADARRAFEAERGTVQQADEAELSAQANLTLIDRQIGHFSKVDWTSWHDSDPFAAQKAFAQYQLLKDARTQTLGHLASLREERTLKEQQDTARRIEEGAAELARDLTDWSPETAAKLLDFGQQHYGFSKEDLDGIDDPRLVKVLHAAFHWEQHQKQQRRAQNHAAAQTTRPAAKVGGATPKAGLDDRLSAEEWLRRRNEQVRRRG
jgi:hypothetical protein